MHLPHSAAFRRVARATDLFLREALSQFVLLPDFGLLLELPNSANVFPLEIAQAVRELYFRFTAWANANLSSISAQGLYWPKSSKDKRVLLQFDQDRNLVDQTGSYLPGLMQALLTQKAHEARIHILAPRTQQGHASRDSLRRLEATGGYRESDCGSQRYEDA